MTCDKKETIIQSGTASPIVAMRKEGNKKYMRKENENCNNIELGFLQICPESSLSFSIVYLRTSMAILLLHAGWSSLLWISFLKGL